MHQKNIENFNISILKTWLLCDIFERSIYYCHHYIRSRTLNKSNTIPEIERRKWKQTVCLQTDKELAVEERYKTVTRNVSIVSIVFRSNDGNNIHRCSHSPRISQYTFYCLSFHSSMHSRLKQCSLSLQTNNKNSILNTSLPKVLWFIKELCDRSTLTLKNIGYVIRETWNFRINWN